MLLRQSGLANAQQLAAQQFENALLETPNDPIIQHALASCYVKQGHYRQAQPILERLVSSRSPETRARTFDLLEHCYTKTSERLKLAELRDKRQADAEAAMVRVRSKRSIESTVRPLVEKPRGRGPKRRHR
jgi:predicted Zn-dependent protease